ncbi:hypothetical protein MRX96_005266 [Rhipicephalus microplus]
MRHALEEALRGVGRRRSSSATSSGLLPSQRLRRPLGSPFDAMCCRCSHERCRKYGLGQQPTWRMRHVSLFIDDATRGSLDRLKKKLRSTPQVDPHPAAL